MDTKRGMEMDAGLRMSEILPVLDPRLVEAVQTQEFCQDLESPEPRPTTASAGRLGGTSAGGRWVARQGRIGAFAIQKRTVLY